ncbi:MAG: endonuclease/exonuclease/phosphatase family protein [Candidatus Izemoplasma sp.]|nr:endonuclease/exonuclease/phosphatase family protein [Candidatus Izemoplasma sp.]
MVVVYGIGILLLLISIIPLYLYLIEYKPESEEDARKYRNNRKKDVENTLSITTLNVGFCGRDRTQEFYTDGGHTAGARTREERFDNLISITSILKDIDSDIFCLQEIDSHGTRTSDINQIEHMASELNSHNIFFAYNYVAKWVQLPLMHPMGNVNSGLALLSKYKIDDSKRIQLQTEVKLTRRLLHPKEAMLVNRIKGLSHDLIIINVHLMPYTQNDHLRRQQLQSILDYADEIYDSLKNYVIIAGDFYYDLNSDTDSDGNDFNTAIIPEGFSLHYDETRPSKRSMTQPYIRGVSEEFTTDGFIVSKNLYNVTIKTHDYEFKHSNHQPVTLYCKVKK